MASEHAHLEQEIRKLASFVPISATVANIIRYELKGEAANRRLRSHIEADNAITVMVLQAANSSFYGFRGQVVTVAHAVMLIGFEEISRIVLMHELRQRIIALNPAQQESVKRLWIHSITTATLSRILCRELGLHTSGEEFTGGLLHDLGKLFFIQNVPDLAGRIAQRIAEGTDDVEAEREIARWPHTDIGALLGLQWDLPPVLCDVMKLHHLSDPLEEGQSIVAVIRLADLFCEKWGYGIGEGNAPDRISEDPCWDHLRRSVAGLNGRTAEEIEGVVKPEFDTHTEFRELFH
ncbi:MAG: HDOD domain-containing protein [Bacteroidetes bacterium]|nr:MAG: HDOD domain-containing protein [Bacteroidota bacterium]